MALNCRESLDFRRRGASVFPMRTAAAILCTAALCAAADASSRRWQCTIAPDSTYTQTTAIALPLAGTWIGNYDATANPAGTKTLPGYFGGSTNTAIPFSSTLKPSASIQNSHPAGGMEVGFDPVTGAMDVSGLRIDILNGQAGAVTVSMLLTYSTFHTVQPSAVYPGVTNVNVPLDNGTLSVATATQNGPAATVAQPLGDGTWTFAMTVPVDAVASGTAMGQPFGGTPTAGLNAQAEHVILPATCHCCFVEDPPLFNERMTDFLTRHGLMPTEP
jgi:hypothetical protein